MGLTVKEVEYEQYEPCPAGTNVAICTGLVSLGVHENTFDPSKPPREKVAIFWTFPELLRKDGTPFMVREVYTCSLAKTQKGATSKLREMLDSWRGRPFTPEELKSFNLTNVLAKPCLINIIHVPKDEKVYANIASVTSVVKGMNIPTLPENFNLLHFDTDEPAWESFETLPQWVKDYIKKAVNWADIELKMNELGSRPTIVEESPEEVLSF